MRSFLQTSSLSIIHIQDHTYLTLGGTTCAKVLVHKTWAFTYAVRCQIGHTVMKYHTLCRSPQGGKIYSYSLSLLDKPPKTIDGTSVYLCRELKMRNETQYHSLFHRVYVIPVYRIRKPVYTSTISYVWLFI